MSEAFDEIVRFAVPEEPPLRVNKGSGMTEIYKVDDGPEANA